MKMIIHFGKSSSYRVGIINRYNNQERKVGSILFLMGEVLLI